MPRKRVEMKGRKKDPSLDAVIVWLLHKNAPLRYDCLEKGVAEKARLMDQMNRPSFKKKIKYDYLRMLLDEKIVRKLIHDHQDYYALFDYAPKDAEVVWIIEEFLRKHGSWPSIEQIGGKMGITPKEAERIAYKLAPLTGWSTAAPDDTDYQDFVGRLELAAWIRIGCRETKFVREHWTPNDIKCAESLLSRYPDLLPIINAYEGESEKIFHYTFRWPDSPIQTNLDAMRVHKANRSDFRGSTGLRIQKRDKTARSSTPEAGDIVT
ncbi:MAG: hypothetical protein ABSF82_13105 [Candidatus Bathyarchaeia archaeon]|jgi:hypothetical protein